MNKIVNYLQYKMFLLNIPPIPHIMVCRLFTIQNVSIKYTFLGTLAHSLIEIYNTKCFY